MFWVLFASWNATADGAVERRETEAEAEGVWSASQVEIRLAVQPFTGVSSVRPFGAH